VKIKKKRLREIVKGIVEEAAAEGKFQKYAKGTYASMIKIAASGGNKNTPPFIKKPSKSGKSAPPGDG